MLVYEMARSNLAELVAELALEYAMSPKWSESGGVTLIVLDENTTEPAARRRMTQFLAHHELNPLSIIIVPGPENAKKFNRRVTVTLRRDQVMPNRKWTAS